MATPRLCSIPGCGKLAKTRGWCKSHYRRWYAHGDPMAGSTYKGELIRFYTETVLSCQSEECLIWPFGKAGSGYGQMRKGGVRNYVHIFACTERHGPQPSSLHEVAHSCGNGHLGCVNPLHLRWATSKENHKDKIAHGTINRGSRHGNSKLSEAEVMAMRKLAPIMSTAALGEKFGVSRQTASDIVSGRRWNWLKG